MRKPDEILLFNTLRREAPGSFNPNTSPRRVGVELGIDTKRVQYLCGKWADRDWYDYGVCVDLGWFLDDAPEEMKP